MITKKRKLQLAAIAVSLAMIATFVFVVTAPGESEDVVASPESGAQPASAVTAGFKVEQYPAVPRQPSQGALGDVPLAYYDSVISDVLAQDEVSPIETWKTARPLAPLVALYSAMGKNAEPIASLSHVTVEDVTSVAVFGEYGTERADGGWLLIGTPSRKSLPTTDSTAPAVTFAYVRAADFEVGEIDRKVTVDTVTGEVQLVAKDGTVLHSEIGTLGSADDPTPHGWGYITATYTGGENATSAGESIALISAHSEKRPSYGENGALTAIHYSTSTRPTSFGCVRVSIAFTRLLEPLIGIPVMFE